MPQVHSIPRREFLTTAGASLLAATAARAPAVIRSAKGRPQIGSGVACGEVNGKSAVLWSRCDRPSRMIVELSTTESFRAVRKLRGPDALAVDDFTAKLRVGDLPVGEQMFYRVRFQDLADPQAFSEPVVGRFRTPPTEPRDVTFAWSGDTAGQGFGIDRARGGMRTYEAIRKLQPDFFVHSGDTIYADQPFPAEIKLPDGTLWKNVVTEETSQAAETLAEFRANFRYNLLDDNVRRFNAEVPLLVQWDDHETTNNWYPGEQLLADKRYQIKSASLLAARGRRAFFDYMPIPTDYSGRLRVHRHVSYGPLLELFFIDLRSFRGPNTPNRQTKTGPDTRFFGKAQLKWLKRRLARSRAVWKVICSDMPLGLIVRDGKNFENGANGNGPPLGRELEIADLLQSMQANAVKNAVWLTADVHYAASHRYDPDKARFQNFDPFWEFVSGPLHAGTFGPNALDDTFGPQVEFQSIKPGTKPGLPPSAGMQFFGTVHIDAKTRAMTVAHYNAAGKKLWSRELAPA